VFGRPESKIARSGRRLLHYRLFQLEPDRGAPNRGDATVEIRGNDLLTAPGVEARYTVVNESQPVSVVFTPLVERRAERGGARAVTFTVKMNGDVVGRHRAPEGQGAEPVAVALPGAERTRAVALSLMTEPALPPGDAGSVARWGNVKVVVG